MMPTRRPPPAVRAVVINHGRVREALALRDALARHVSTLAIDSGSHLEAGEAARFAAVLPNVYYGGLLNASVEACADLADDDVLFLVASDVSVPEPGRTLQLLLDAFVKPRTGVWGPSATGATFPDQANHGRGGMRPVAYVEGFCLAARLGLYRALTPVDLEVNRLGWGLDVHLAYLARMCGQEVWIDDRVTVHHSAGSRYDHHDARRQMARWLATQGRGARAANALLLRPWMHSALGSAFVYLLPRGLWPALFRIAQ